MEVAEEVNTEVATMVVIVSIVSATLTTALIQTFDSTSHSASKMLVWLATLVATALLETIPVSQSTESIVRRHLLQHHLTYFRASYQREPRFPKDFPPMLRSNSAASTVTNTTRRQGRKRPTRSCIKSSFIHSGSTRF